MASPQPTGQPTATTTAAPPQRTAPQRTGAIFGIVGGVLAIVGFFLPWTVQASQNVTQPGPAAYSTISGWDIVTQWMNGSSFLFPGQTAGQGGTPLYSIAFIFALPLLLAVVVLVVCAISLSRRPGPVLSGLYVSAAIIGLLSAIGDKPSTFLAYVLTPVPSLPNISPWVGIGIAVMYLGYLGIFAGSVMAIIAHRQA